MGDEIKISEIEAIFNEDNSKSSTADDQRNHEVDLDKIKMTSNTDFERYNSPPKMVHMGKIKDGSENGQKFILVRNISQEGKAYCDVYLKAGVCFKTAEGSKSFMAGEINYQHGMMDAQKKHSVFVYDNGTYFGYDLKDYVPMNSEKKE